MKLVELLSTVTRLLLTTRGETHSVLIPEVAQAFHVEVAVNPQPLDRLIPELQRLPETPMLSMKVLSAAVGAQLAGMGDPLPHELAGCAGFKDSTTDGEFGTVLPPTSTTRICICRSCTPVDGHIADAPCWSTTTMRWSGTPTLVLALVSSWSWGHGPPPLSSLGPKYIITLCALLLVVPAATPPMLLPLAVAIEVSSVHQVEKSPVIVEILSVQESMACTP
jgi:hypothetical protein